MAYSTGSGTYTAMMAAILAHAITDGWTEVGGVSSGWPIQSPNALLFADWATDTAGTTDVTQGGGGVSVQRNIRYGFDFASAANATSDAVIGEVVSPNANFTINAWHIFSDITVADFIHCVFEFSNGADTKVFSHMGIGMLDQYGLTHGGVAIAGGHYGRGWAVTTANGTSSLDWNSLNRTNHAYAGQYGEADDGSSQLTMVINPTNHPIPGTPGVGGWPNTGTRIQDGANVWCMSRPGVDQTGPNHGTANISINWSAASFDPQPFSGSVSMMPLPIFIINGTSSGSLMFFAGQVPLIRLCSMEGFAEGDEVTYGADTWKLFPMLCLKPNSQLMLNGIVSSGQVGYAYKKVT